MDTRTAEQQIADATARIMAAKAERARALALYEGDGTQDSGMSLQGVADVLKISKQRAHQMVTLARVERKEAQQQTV